MTTANFCFYLQNRLIPTGQTGGQLYIDTSPFSVPFLHHQHLDFARFFYTFASGKDHQMMNQGKLEGSFEL
jgi:hypothetical protein